MDLLNQSSIKSYAFKVLEAIDKMARPEVQNPILGRIWDFIKNYTARKILAKPDSELQKKLKDIHDILNPLFTQVNIATGISQGEKLGSPPIPRIGNIKEIMELVDNL